MEKSSPPPSGGQVIQPTPLRTKLTFGRYQWVHHTTPARAKEIGKSPSSLKKFRDAKTEVSQLARLADVDGQKGSFPLGHTAIDDVRDAMKAGNVEPFFIILTLYGPRGHYACLSDPTILGITQGWWDAANSGDRDARALLARISPALARASYRRPRRANKEPRLLHREASSKSKASSQLMRRFKKDVVDGRPSKQAYENTVRNYCDSSPMTIERKEFALEEFDKKVVEIHPGLKSTVDRKTWRKLLPRGG